MSCVVSPALPLSISGCWRCCPHTTREAIATSPSWANAWRSVMWPRRPRHWQSWERCAGKIMSWAVIHAPVCMSSVRWNVEVLVVYTWPQGLAVFIKALDSARNWLSLRPIGNRQYTIHNIWLSWWQAPEERMTWSSIAKRPHRANQL